MYTPSTDKKLAVLAGLLEGNGDGYWGDERDLAVSRFDFLIHLIRNVTEIFLCGS